MIPENEEGWTVERLAWDDPSNQEKKRALNESTGWHFLQGREKAVGHLIGGCLDVLDWLRGTDVWPTEQWENAILFIETSEDAPPPNRVVGFLRSLAAMGILSVLKGILVGRLAGTSCHPIRSQNTMTRCFKW